ncbi:hypothetical protein B0O80DRAFT_491406 [Mortierella sp. GBAus27b]|nr:hypothetical protein B0O80DRAFT_491406 [Mortierella sp. GBAus27b]
MAYRNIAHKTESILAVHMDKATTTLHWDGAPLVGKSMERCNRQEQANKKLGKLEEDLNKAIMKKSSPPARLYHECKSLFRPSPHILDVIKAGGLQEGQVDVIIGSAESSSPLALTSKRDRYAISNIIRCDGLQVHALAYDMRKPHQSSKARLPITDIEKAFPNQESIDTRFPDKTNAMCESAQECKDRLQAVFSSFDDLSTFDTSKAAKRNDWERVKAFRAEKDWGVSGGLSMVDKSRPSLGVLVSTPGPDWRRYTTASEATCTSKQPVVVSADEYWSIPVKG